MIIIFFFFFFFFFSENILSIVYKLHVNRKSNGIQMILSSLSYVIKNNFQTHTKDIDLGEVESWGLSKRSYEKVFCPDYVSKNK